MLSILLGVVMFAAAYLTHTGKFTLFYSYYNPRMDQSKIDEIEAKRKKNSTVLLLLMGVVAILSAVLKMASVIFYAELCMAIYMFLIIFLLGTTLGGESNKTVFTVISVVIAFLYFSTSFRQAFQSNYFDFETTPGNMIIGGSYETELKLSEIDSIELLENRPEKDQRIGTVYEFNGAFHGKYTLKGGGKGHIFYNGESKMCVKMTANGETYYLSMQNDKDTEDVKAMIEDVKENGWNAVKDKYMPKEEK